MPIDVDLVRAVGVAVVDHDGLTGRRGPHRAVQTSTIAALLDGRFDGDTTVGELLAEGDLGLGTLDALDGELIVVDGKAWAAAVDGTVRRVAPHERTPFAVVTAFVPDRETALPGPLDHDALLDLLEGLAPPSGCDAVRIDGRFDRVDARSVPRQHRPYPGLVEAASQQVTYGLRDVEGTVVGFRFPRAAEGIEVTGHHLHFIAADRTCGGHVLRCDVRDGVVAVARVEALRLELPAGVALPGPDAGRAAAVRRVESGPGA